MRKVVSTFFLCACSSLVGYTEIRPNDVSSAIDVDEPITEVEDSDIFWDTGSDSDTDDGAGTDTEAIGETGTLVPAHDTGIFLPGTDTF